MAEELYKAIQVYLLGKQVENLDLFDHIQITGVVKACKNSQSIADAGRKLFNRSRMEKSSVNDTHRLKQLLKKYGLTFSEVKKREFDF